MRIFRNEQIKLTVEIKGDVVSVYRDWPISIIFPEGRKRMFQKNLRELKNVPTDEAGYIEHLESIGFREV